ncbi:hypothetical protein [Streptomyces sp. NPDC058620]|uniref:hypothetical protein n=1 Tax=Streptomyces sp. NPDC058620 TaxID=3346560 RepID=UPI003648FF5D
MRRSTVFVLAECLGWVEILRRDIQFRDLGRSRVIRQIMLLQISWLGASPARTHPSDEPRLSGVQERDRAPMGARTSPHGRLTADQTAPGARHPPCPRRVPGLC